MKESRAGWNAARRPPTADEHTDEVLGELGYTPAAIEELRARGVV